MKETTKDLQGLVKQSLTSVALHSQSQEALLPQRLQADGCVEITPFRGDKASPTDILFAINKLSTAFPARNQSFWELLSLRIAERGMTTEELEYAVNETIDNFNYQTLTIADIMKQGVKLKVKLLSYSAMLAECAKNGTTTEDYCTIKVRGVEKPCWLLKTDKAIHHIPDEL